MARGVKQGGGELWHLCAQEVWYPMQVRGWGWLVMAPEGIGCKWAKLSVLFVYKSDNVKWEWEGAQRCLSFSVCLLRSLCVCVYVCVAFVCAHSKAMGWKSSSNEERSHQQPVVPGKGEDALKGLCMWVCVCMSVCGGAYRSIKCCTRNYCPNDINFHFDCN